MADPIQRPPQISSPDLSLGPAEENPESSPGNTPLTKLDPYYQRYISTALAKARQGDYEAIYLLGKAARHSSWDRAELRALDISPFRIDLEAGNLSDLYQLDKIVNSIRSLKNLALAGHSEAKDYFENIDISQLRQKVEEGDYHAAFVLEHFHQAQHPQVASMIQHVDLESLWQRAFHADDPQELGKISNSASIFARLGVPQAKALSDWSAEETIKLREEKQKCEVNPFCFNGDWGVMPNARIGYAAIVGVEDAHHVNGALKLFIYNRDYWNTLASHSFGIAPEAQFHTGDGRDGGSFGASLRYMLNNMDGWFRFGMDLSLRGGLGHLEQMEDDIFYNDRYHFVAADVSLWGNFLFFGPYLGVGLRKEFWPQGTDAVGQRVESQEDHLYPVITTGLGFL